jgi:hypothetical protein
MQAAACFADDYSNAKAFARGTIEEDRARRLRVLSLAEGMGIAVPRRASIRDTSTTMKTLAPVFAIVFATALLLATGTAHAQRPTYISLPPAEYDKPYVGKLRIIRIDTEESLRAECPTSEYACSQTRLATAIFHQVWGLVLDKTVHEHVCELYIASDEILKKVPVSYALH